MVVLYLDSDYSSYKFDNSSPTDLIFNINGVLSDDYDVYKLALLEMTIPNIEPTFQTGINTSLVFRENGGVVDFVATIAEGTYNGTDLATEIQLKMNAVVGIANSYTCAYNQSTLKFIISANIPNTFSIRSNSTCLKELGYVVGTSTSFAVTHTSPYIVNLIGSRYVDVVVNHSTNSISTGVTQRSNILARCEFSVPKGSIEKYQVQVPMYHNVPRNSLSSLEIKFYNDKGRQCIINPNHTITLILSIDPVM